MIVGLASDHRGFEKKAKLIKYLEKKGLEVKDFGTNSSESCDFPDYSNLLCDAIINEEVNFGVLICGTGIGMSIAANKRKGIYCGKVDSAEEAKLTKEHNHANVIAISANKYMFQIKDMLDAYLEAKNLTDEKYVRRIEKIKEIEGKRK